MTWNHRVFKRVHKNGETTYGIHEAYYDKDGQLEAWTDNPTHLQCESVDSLRWTLEKMIECLDREVLDYEVESSDSPAQETGAG